MRSQVDALRSLKRYVWEALGEEWEVRLWADRGEFKYPFARVQEVAGSAVAGPALWAEITQPYSIECYPEPADEVDASILRASQVQANLHQAFRGPGVGAGRALRIPLYNYDLVPITESAEATDREEHDFMRLVDFSSRKLPDVEDPRRVAVVADVRLRWTHAGDNAVNRDTNGNPVLATQLVESLRLDFES